MRELSKKKQSDPVRFLRRLRTWNYRQLPRVHRVTRPTRPDKARVMGFKKAPGFSVMRVRIRRGGRKRPNVRGIVYGKPANHVRLTNLSYYFLFNFKQFNKKKNWF